MNSQESLNKTKKILNWVATLLTGFLIIFFFISITRVVETGSPGSLGYRIGAICEDGWRSSSTGSGTCSWHGGVDHWIYRGGTASTLEEHLLIADIYGWLILFSVIDVVIIYSIKQLNKKNS
jgi:hypothetical protein